MATLIVNSNEICSVRTRIREDLNSYELLIYLKNDDNSYYIYKETKKEIMELLEILIDRENTDNIEVKTCNFLDLSNIRTTEC